MQFTPVYRRDRRPVLWWRLQKPRGSLRLV